MPVILLVVQLTLSVKMICSVLGKNQDTIFDHNRYFASCTSTPNYGEVIPLCKCSLVTAGLHTDNWLRRGCIWCESSISAHWCSSQWQYWSWKPHSLFQSQNTLKTNTTRFRWKPLQLAVVGTFSLFDLTVLSGECATEGWRKCRGVGGEGARHCEGVTHALAFAYTQCKEAILEILIQIFLCWTIQKWKDTKKKQKSVS